MSKQRRTFSREFLKQFCEENEVILDDLPDKVFATWRNPGERDRVSDFLQK